MVWADYVTSFGELDRPTDPWLFLKGLQRVERLLSPEGIRLHKVIPTISWLLFRCYFWRMKEKYIIRDFHPLIFFLTFGMALSGTAMIFGAYLAYLRLAVGPVSPVSAIFVALSLTSGMQSILFALWMDMERNKDLK